MKDSAIRKSVSVAVKMNGSLIVKTGQRTVPSQIPGTPILHLNNSIFCSCLAVGLILDDMDGPGKNRASCELEVQRRNGVNRNVSLHFLIPGRKVYPGSIFSGSSPSISRIVARHDQQFSGFVLIVQQDVVQRNIGLRVRRSNLALSAEIFAVL